MVDIPETFLQLLPRSIDQNLYSDFSPKQAALIHLRNNLFKKWLPSGDSQHADKAALDLFIESNEQCSRWCPDEESYLFDIMTDAKRRLDRRLHSGELQSPIISLARAIDNVRPGPGSSIGTRHQDFLSKMFCSKLTSYSSMLWKYYQTHIPSRWQLAEKAREIQFGGCDVVTASRMTFAKKNSVISRAINTEASLDMLFQLGHGAVMEDCLESWFSINLSTQPTINRFLAMIGSLYGSHATVDLKSASDLNSTRFMSWYFPADVFKSLDTVRPKWIETPGGNIVQLHTFSTMGNGFTFPLQTMVFASIVEAAYISLDIPVDNSGAVPAFSVFGDDIICVERAYDRVCKLLAWCGFRVNVNKSFNSGCFRESCGEDYFKGHNIRSCYLKELSHESQVYSFFNRLARWSIRNGVDVSGLLKRVRDMAEFLPVPFDAQDVAGFKIPLHLSGKRYGKSGLTWFNHLKPKRRMRTYKHDTQPDALLVSALGGYVTGDARLTEGSLTGTRHLLCHDSVFKPLKETSSVGVTVLRNVDETPSYVTGRSSTQSWDWIPTKGLTILDFSILWLAITI